ncbi:MAG: polysaccharide biosynthesis tyrosine autokinase, partial [Adhaeribacter sp.]|nr:polysaccharide biosynthesis tyrosine autokinase [Adhaeribacter sp.]
MALEKFADIDELNSRVADSESEEEGGSEVDFVTLLTVARKSLIWVVLLILLGLTASYLFLRYTKPVYKSSSIIKIDEQSQAGALGLGGPLGDAAGNQKTMASLSGEVELIKSDLIYENLKRRLNLKVSYFAVGNVLNEELYNSSPFKVTFDIKNENFYNKNFNVQFQDKDRFKLAYLIGEEEISGEYRFGEKIEKEGISLTLYPNDNFNVNSVDGKYYFVINSDGALNDYFNRNLTVEIVNPDAHTIGIFFTDFNPTKARDIVNELDSAYLEQKIRQKNLATSQIEKFLNEQLKETQDKLANSEGKMENFVRANKTYDVKADVSTQISKLEGLSEERLNLVTQLSLLREVAQLINQDSDLDQVIPSLKTVEDQELSSRIAELSDMQLYYKLLLRSYKPETEAVKRTQKEISLTKEAASELLEQNIRLMEKEVATISSNMGAIEGKLQNMPQKETERARLARVFGIDEKYYLSLMDKKVEYGISKAGTVADFQILSPASLPGSPISPDRMIVYAIGLASGLMLGIGLIAGRYFMHNTVTSVSEIERNTRAAVLGVVPHYTREKLPISKLIVDKNPKSVISESIRSIRTNLEFINSS